MDIFPNDAAVEYAICSDDEFDLDAEETGVRMWQPNRFRWKRVASAKVLFFCAHTILTH